MSMVSQTFYEILAMLVFTLVAINRKKIAEWERKMWKKLKRFIRRQLRKSPRIVAWAETPTKHGRPDDEWVTGQIQVWGEWR